MAWWVWLIIVAVILIGGLIALYIVGNKLQKKQSAQKEMMKEQAQPVTMLVIDKKMLPMKDAGLPKMVMEQTPKRYQKAKMPIVKAKIGPQIMNLICDDGIYDQMPVRGEVKAMVSGIYIMSVKNVRGKIEEKKGKKTFGEKLRAKQRKYQDMYDKDVAESKLSKDQKAAAKAKAKEEKRELKRSRRCNSLKGDSQYEEMSY